jgi:hypothetical protein
MEASDTIMQRAEQLHVVTKHRFVLFERGARLVLQNLLLPRVLTS